MRQLGPGSIDWAAGARRLRAARRWEGHAEKNYAAKGQCPMINGQWQMSDDQCPWRGVRLAEIGISLAMFRLSALRRAGQIVRMPRARYDLEDRLMRFAVAACRLAETLPVTALGQHVGGQIIRSATSPLANYGEVQGAYSRRDFVYKLSICVKELRETRAWMKLIGAMELCGPERLRPVMQECDELLAILTSSIRTAQRNGLGRM